MRNISIIYFKKMVRKCLVCKSRTRKPLYEFPNDVQLRLKWLEALEGFCDVSNISDYTVICPEHFDSTCFSQLTNRLLQSAVPNVLGPFRNLCTIEKPKRRTRNRNDFYIPMIDVGIHRLKRTNASLAPSIPTRNVSIGRDETDPFAGIPDTSEPDVKKVYSPMKQKLGECTTVIKQEMKEEMQDSDVSSSDVVTQEIIFLDNKINVTSDGNNATCKIDSSVVHADNSVCTVKKIIRTPYYFLKVNTKYGLTYKCVVCRKTLDGNLRQHLAVCSNKT